MNSSLKDLAVIAVSGGMDSCVTAAIANEKYELAFAHINYGQRTEKRELRAFNDVADYFGVKVRLVVDYSHLSKIGGSSLTDKDIAVSKADLNNQIIPTSYVPFRNANILSACVSWAEVLGAKSVFIGAVFEDSSGYPDCRPDFFSAFEKMARKGKADPSMPSYPMKSKKETFTFRKISLSFARKMGSMERSKRVRYLFSLSSNSRMILLWLRLKSSNCF